MIFASSCVGLHRFPGEVIAFDEHFIDFVNGLSAVARRMARPERRQELQIWCGFPPLLPAGETFGLARKILKCRLEGLKSPGETLGAGQAIGGRRRSERRGRKRALPALPIWLQPWDRVGERKPMRGTSRVDFMARTGLIRFRGSKSWKEGGLLLPMPLAVGFAGLGIGREGASFTTRPRAAMTIRRRTADSAGGAPAARRGGGDAKSAKPWPRLPAPAWRKGPQRCP